MGLSLNKGDFVRPYLKLILQFLFIFLTVVWVYFFIFKIIAFILSLFFVTIFVAKSEKKSKGIKVKGNFLIITEILMILWVIYLSFSVYRHFFFVPIVFSAFYIYFSIPEFKKLIAIS